ncbi:two-component regulator propeller domain-containing protein [uncultured Bacteroides sp.]|uniref:two-component regulator propeller domain-containing protein n=1 Tax=uncultured Bacteroides sp. TaxID=162156 RepID=UPI0026762ADE|nr:two-component regulator propeller domain-containing protein [uncultured Bacteroides sp.]
MRRRMITTLFLICIFCINCNIYGYGRKINYQQFDNMYLGAEASVISCFLQDSEGLIWIGSNKGLFSYDGYSMQQHFTYGEYSNTRIYCGIIIDNTYLYLGTDDEMLVYNYRTDKYEQPEIELPTDVRTMALQGDTLWIGSLNGLYTYELKSKKLVAYNSTNSGLSHNTIYSIIRTRNNQIYIGTYNGLCRYTKENGDFEKIPLPVNHDASNLFVNSLLEDTTRQCIWIGMEGHLFRYTPQTGNMQPIEAFHNNSVKSLALDGEGNLLAGTDNGLYIYRNADGSLQHIVHDSRNIQSLTNNIIWNIFADQEHNIWLGTDYGISLSRYNSAMQFIPISQITGTGDGNQFYSLFRDSKGFYWFGGTNGIIRFNNPTGNSHDAVWYRMGDKKYPLSHNRIRHIYEDKEQHLWIATDGSINRYDYKTRQFVHYNIVDSTGTNNANWAYYLFEDTGGKLWIATCLGGIFVVDKHKLMQSAGKPYVAEQNYSTRNGLSGMFINQIVPDTEGNVWVLLYNSKGIDKINPRTRQVTKLFADELSGEKSPNYLLRDEDGMLWVGFHGGLMRINPKDSSRQSVSFGSFNNNEILSMTSVKEHIWISTTNGIWIINRKNMDVCQQNMTDKRFTCLLFDSKDENIYLGGADGFGISRPEIQAMVPPERPILLTAIYINNLLMSPRTGAAIPNIRYTSSIELEYNQNNLAFELSDLPYSLEEKHEFVYRLEGMDKEWNFLKSNTNRITYSNLNYGNYRLLISRIEKNGYPSEHPYILDIKILPPWYYTLWAKITYVLLFFCLIAWTVNFFRVKNRLKTERIEKEKILEQSHQKIAFFTHLSNKLKTPLSRIIAPVSQLLPGTEETDERQTLEEVQRNAMKINSLIHQILNFNRIEDNEDSLLILSRIELVSFCHSLFSVYEEDKHLNFHFETNKAKIYADMDAIKLGVIIDSLLSNAVKFTPEGGSIRLSLFYREETGLLDICVSDTGIGIPQQDIPYIFQRFFQSPHSGNREGTGIGLYLVKTYTELHGGHINGITSEEGKGTSVGLCIPIIAVEEKEMPATQAKKQPEALPVLKPIEAESQDEKFLSNITRLIEDHLSDSELNVNALCELSGIGNKQIYRKVKQLTGMSPVEYIKSIRMKKAAMLLQQKKFTVAEVMYMVGFSNHSYFSKCFQAEFGKTPRQYLNDSL